MNGGSLDLYQYSIVPSNLVRIQMEEKIQTGVLSRDGCTTHET